MEKSGREKAEERDFLLFIIIKKWLTRLKDGVYV